jgi:hypothetical protein
MKNRLLTLAGALALLAILGKYFAVPVMAQIRAALVQNMDEPGRRPYQVTVTLNPAVDFKADFPAVPAGQRLVVQQIMVSTTNNVNTYGAFFLLVGSTTVFQAVLTTDTFSPVPTRQLSTPLTAYVDGGQHASAHFVFVPNGGDLATITLIGHLIDCVAASCSPIVQ